jgi:hypothetical protein
MFFTSLAADLPSIDARIWMILWVLTFPISVLGCGRYNPHILLGETILMFVLACGLNKYPWRTLNFRHQLENLSLPSLAADLPNIRARMRMIPPSYPARRDNSNGGSRMWLGQILTENPEFSLTA